MKITTPAETAPKQKAIHFEVMRLLAIFFVVFMHTADNGFFLFSKYPDTSIPFWAYLFLTVFSTMAVPLFFMISGALLLNRPEESLGTLWKKRVFRYGVLLVAICFLYYFQMRGFDLSAISLKEFIIVLYSYSAGDITWFLYSYLAFLILLPVFRVLAQNMKNGHFLYVLAIALIYRGVIPVLEYLAFQGSQTLNPNFTLGWIAENIVLFPLMGYYLEHRMKCSRQGRMVGILWIVNVLTILLTCGMTVYRGRIMGEYLEGISEYFFPCFVLINGVTLYLTISLVCRKTVFSKGMQKLICSVGQSTLGMYLLHFFFMQLPGFEKIRQGILNTGMNDMLAAVLYCLVVAALSYAVTFVLRKIPVVNKYI